MLRYLTFLFCFSFNFSFGQQSNQSVEDTISYSVDLENVMITAQYKPTHYKEALYNVSILKENQINERGATQLDQALVVIPSIRFIQDPMLGPQIRMRGISSSNVAVLIDGVPVVGRSNGGIDMSQLAMQNIQRIEIVEGPLSAIYGNNAAGGVINIITKRSQLKTFEFSGEHQLESIGNRNNQLRFGFQKDKFFLAGYGRLFSYDQFPMDSLRLTERITLDNNQSIMQFKYPWNPKEQYSYGANASYSFNDDNRITLKYDFNNEFLSNFGSVRRPNFNPYSDDRFFTTSRNDVAFIYNGLLKDKYHIELTSSLNNYLRISDDKRFYINTMEFDSLLQKSDTSLFKTYFTRFHVAFPINKKLDFLVGTNVNHDTGGGDRVVNPADSGLNTVNITETAVYTDIKYNPFSNLKLGGTFRLTNNSIYGSQLTPAFQLKYDLNTKLTLRGSYAQGFRSPDIKELYIEFIDVNHFIQGNVNLTPEISHDYQATLSYSPWKNFDVNLNAFHTTINNRIILSEISPLNYRYENVSNYTVQGLQSEVKYQYKGFESSTSGSIGYWATNITANDAPRYGQVLDFNQSIRQRIPFILADLMVNYRFVGAQPLYRIENDILKVRNIEAYQLLDVSLNKSIFKQKLSFTLGVKNLLDVGRVGITGVNTTGPHTTGESNLIAQGRNGFIALRWKI